MSKPSRHPDAGSDNSDAGEQPQIVVDDPEDFAKTRQLRSIFDARDTYVKARQEANAAFENGELNFPSKNRRIFRHVQDFAMAVEPLAQKHETDIWIDKTYRVDEWARPQNVPSFAGAKKFCKENYPELHRQFEGCNGARFGGLTGKQKKLKNRMIWAAASTGVEFTGVEELISGTPKLRYLTGSQREIMSSTPPQRLSDEVFRDLQMFVDDIGLGFDMSTEQQTKIDDELLEEVDEWRRENT